MFSKMSFFVILTNIFSKSCSLKGAIAVLRIFPSTLSEGGLPSLKCISETFALCAFSKKSSKLNSEIKIPP